MTKKKSIKSKEKANNEQKYIVGSINFKHLINLKKEIRDGLKKSRTNLVRAALIKLFELAYDQGWKTLQKVLMEFYSINTIGSRDTFREAAKANLIDDCERWLDFIKDRSRTIYTYNHSIADQIIDNLEDFITELEILIQNLDELGEKLAT